MVYFFHFDQAAQLNGRPLEVRAISGEDQGPSHKLKFLVGRQMRTSSILGHGLKTSQSHDSFDGLTFGLVSRIEQLRENGLCTILDKLPLIRTGILLKASQTVLEIVHMCGDHWT